jgi:hypothetical protein
LIIPNSQLIKNRVTVPVAAATIDPRRDAASISAFLRHAALA